MEQLFRRRVVRARIAANPLGPILRQYIGYLVARGHKPNTFQSYVFAVEHFGRWLGRRPVDHESVARFLRIHIPRCRCEKPASRTETTLRAALNRLLEMRGLPRPAPNGVVEIERLLREYEMHLRHTCGLAPSTVTGRVRHARELLEHFNVRTRGQIKNWLPTDLGEYVATAGGQVKPGSGQKLASSVRSFARFLLLKQLVRRDLSAGIPSFANWRLAALPPVVDRADLEKMIRAVDASTVVGRRDRAVLLCLVDLGLRAGDVTALSLDNIDLVSGILRFESPKVRRVSEWPMTHRLASALRQYVERGRPTCTSRGLFVIHRAPVGRPLKPIGIRGIVVRYAAKAGLAGVVRGTNVIRHSVASSMINGGARLKDIADLLGHRSIDTTAIYMKVDLHSLAAVAMPWPEVRQ